jgi:hypothetical protein
MTIVSNKEFAINQKKYFDMAVNEDIVIKRGKNIFHLIYTPVEKCYSEQPVLEPDDDFYNAISGDEFKKKALEIVEKVHNRYYSK